MANHKSAKKRYKQAIKRNEVNKSLLSKIKNNINIFHSLVSSKKVDEIQKSLSSVNSALAKAVKKGLIKKEFASRKLSSLSSTIDKNNIFSFFLLLFLLIFSKECCLHNIIGDLNFVVFGLSIKV